jgi:hypothetical protein
VSAFFNRCALVALAGVAGAFFVQLSLFGNLASAGGNSAAQSKQKNPQSRTGTLEKMIVASGSVAMDIDLNRLNGISSATQKLETLGFVVTRLGTRWYRGRCRI